MDDKTAKITAAILGGLLAVGLLGAGYFVSTTVLRGRMAGNAVTVKGFAERDVRADLALWTIGYSNTGGRLSDLYAKTRADEAAILTYLRSRAFDDKAINVQGVNLTDQAANQDRSKVTPEASRYLLAESIVVRSNDVARVGAATRGLDDLISKGVTSTQNQVDFEFTRLSDIKAPMLKEATENARGAAQQFANDAGAKVGSIQAANQGLFSINSRDAAAGTPGDDESSGGANTIEKRVRVVVTLTYYLQR
ncbi:MAG: SIMPL domain-containing protein [Caulobacteraceae bacterium]